MIGDNSRVVRVWESEKKKKNLLCGGIVQD